MLRRLSECVLALAFVVPIASSFVLNSPKALLRNPITTSLYTATPPTIDSTTTSTPVLPNEDEYVDEISDQKPLRVLIAGAGVGGLTLAHELSKSPHVQVQVLERTSKFKRFGGPIQLASNALQILSAMDPQVYAEINSKFTVTGDKENGIKGRYSVGMVCQV